MTKINHAMYSLGLIQSKRGILPIYNFDGGNNDRQEVSFIDKLFSHCCTFKHVSLSIYLFERFAERPIQFEISIGNAGNSTDGFSPLETWADLSALDDSGGMDTCLQATWRSTCPADTCQSWDKSNYFLQFGDEKPTMYVRWEAVI